MRRYVVRLGSFRDDGLYLVREVDVDEWQFSTLQRRARRWKSLYQAEVVAEQIGDARVVRLSGATRSRGTP